MLGKMNERRQRRSNNRVSSPGSVSATPTVSGNDDAVTESTEASSPPNNKTNTTITNTTNTKMTPTRSSNSSKGNNMSNSSSSSKTKVKKGGNSEKKLTSATTTSPTKASATPSSATKPGSDVGTPIPKAKQQNEAKSASGVSNSQQRPLQSQQSSSSVPLPQPTSRSESDGAVPLPAKSGEQVKKDESRLHKILQRIIIGVCMMSAFCCILYAGHLYVCMLVALLETLLFSELVRVRYNANYHNIKDTIPLFRTTQWMWFAVAIFYTYGDFLTDMVENNQTLHHLLPVMQYTGSASFLLYSTTLVVTIVTLQREHIKFQINQLCWTVMVLCLTLGQLKYVMHNIFNGLIWFVMPCCLVICNDVMAYVCGMSMGRKFTSRPFLSFSPNKTWEGFCGGGFFTLVCAWYLSNFLAQYSWMTCPETKFNLFPTPLECTPDPIFVPAQWVFPSQMFELLPQTLVRTLPGVVQICSSMVMKPTAFGAEDAVGITAEGDPFRAPSSAPMVVQELEPCVSGNYQQVHHHFELRYGVNEVFYPIQVHALWLAMFASVVAPFGGFLASAIKRAYGIKDFASIIPGHGGVMDRMDCQFTMALCVWVHYNTFVKIATVSVTKLSYLYSLLSKSEQDEFLRLVMEAKNEQDTSL